MMGLTERQKSEYRNIAKEVSKEIVHDLMGDDRFLECLADKLADKVSEKVNRRLEDLATKINTLETKIAHIQGDNENLMIRIDELEQKSKLDQLRIYGITEEREENLKPKIENISISKMGMKNVKLLQCYRIGNPNPNKSRAVIIKFENIQERNLAYDSKKLLKGCRITLVEDLTKARHEILLYAKEKIGPKMVWTMQGRIYTKVNGKKICLRSEDDVLKIDQ
ncbi:unnamed protein product [Phaedon cochleariae]|uniref:Uncharacterized protein n=1 Tax=Phaedon cochleariae TaxID=80249 RepID=A0A9N9SG73_PHACE|nr:unnamed protein product [Phaedon cochleariae]